MQEFTDTQTYTRQGSMKTKSNVAVTDLRADPCANHCSASCAAETLRHATDRPGFIIFSLKGTRSMLRSLRRGFRPSTSDRSLELHSFVRLPQLLWRTEASVHPSISRHPSLTPGLAAASSQTPHRRSHLYQSP